MKTLCRDVLISLIMGLLLPWMLLNYAETALNQNHVISIMEESEEIAETIPRETDPKVMLSVNLQTNDGKIEQMDMDTYLVGVVLAEMPAFFEEEALKAQSVVARTYAWKAYTTGGKHGNNSVCANSACCQAYLSEAEYLEQGGRQANVDKIRSAVYATSGYVLIYGDTLIEATYFSCSGGSTEDAAAVWGTDFPYLRAVSSPGEEKATYYTDTKTFTLQNFQNALGLSLPDDVSKWLGEVSYTSGGGVDTMQIGGKIFKGTQLRQLLGLKSTAFTITFGENSVTVTTRGFGHRVGMSQYGADAMAAAGSSYEEILAYYYQGTVLQQCAEMEIPLQEAA